MAGAVDAFRDAERLGFGFHGVVAGFFGGVQFLDHAGADGGIAQIGAGKNLRGGAGRRCRA